ncbi:TPA: 30S ribosomal protein S17e [archaeon]|uniref:Small ribosomal subunit protein eS17 n=1 Tax=Candidatus Naiadarchaeum limnaeum TaxID=2756139 RepID=A0A832XMB3_9ARCH|nr:30S ribosomal protein S17e [Candidatus Naiadarchaeales archaeon SRR2090153.bin1042]HIK00968.1 30S ribosomal protein S17e [Candidatus Naiadarchaeum limnaeum]
MGRIKTTFIKRVGEELLQKYKERFSKDYENNKKVLQEMINSGTLVTPSKKMRNKVAGYMVRAVRPTHNPMYKAAPEVKRRPVRRFTRR